MEENKQNTPSTSPTKTKRKTSIIKEQYEAVKSKVKSSNKKVDNKKTNLKKLKLLITIVDRNKTLFYVDLLEQFEINMQMVFYGHGTAEKDMLELLGLANQEKAIILSIVREDKIKEATQTLQEKFEVVRNGKGIAFTVPLQSVIGVYAYQFLSNNQSGIKEDK
ncbi:MAG: hypothetical protein IJV94_02170 [Bacilli bacterium]|nr:hypothetical protein [Bacilli bacterium]